MPPLNASITPAEIRYQQQALSEVSRTFALTIPLLPMALEHAVGNAYLLCRIADTIEDDGHMSAEQKSKFSLRLIDLVKGGSASDEFATELSEQLSSQTPETERSLVSHTSRVLQITRKLGSAQVTAIQTCVSQMATAMPDFQRSQNGTGLPDIATLNSYCYAVAGVVGELLTSFFCAHSRQINEHREQLTRLAFSFGQGLQLTNILKDIHIDRMRGICWLPKDVFSTQGGDLTQLDGNGSEAETVAGLDYLIGITRYHLDNALKYALTIPASEKEIRRFLVFPLLLAQLTVRKIHASRGSALTSSVKISRRSVILSNLFVKAGSTHDMAIRQLMKQLSRDLPAIK